MELKLLFSKGSKSEALNYGPILLLPLISKIFEEIIHDQTTKSLKETSFCVSINLNLEKITQRVCVCLI